MSVTKSEHKPRNMKVYCMEDMEHLLKGVKVAACMLTDPQPIVVDEESVLKRVNALTISLKGGQQCSSCGVNFDSRAQQISHYKHHWHAHNLKRRLFGKPAVSLAQFTSRQEDSSVSGSDSDDDPGHSAVNSTASASDLFAAATRHCKAFFTNATGEVFCLYRCILHHRKEVLSTDGEGSAWISRVKELSQGTQRWAMLMISGGHFAGAIFSGGAAVLHKTFHSYVARRGQGQAQSSRDQQGNAPKSAGASLRRYNQAQFSVHIQEILTSWTEELSKCSLVLYRAVGPLNQAVLFGKSSPLSKDDTRLRAFPFPTRKPTYKEVQRAHAIVCNIEVYDTMELFQKALIASSAPAGDERARKPKSSPKQIDRAKSREPVARELPAQVESSEDDGPCYIDSETPVDWIKTLSDHTAKGKSKEKEVEEVDKEDSSGSEDESGPQKEKKKKKKKKKEDKPKKPALPAIPETVKKLWKVIDSGSLCSLESMLEELTQADGVDLASTVNSVDPADGNTALHKAAIISNPDMIKHLLNAGGDPCVRNRSLQTPYAAATRRDARDAFRWYQGEHPDRHNYAKANIPGPLTESLLAEELERKAAQRRAKRQRDKDRQVERAQTSRFLDLNDVDKVKEGAPRCFLCGSKLPKAAFQYEQYKFCSVKCLQNHRNVRPLNLPA